jgi:hypothetical protein
MFYEIGSRWCFLSTAIRPPGKQNGLHRDVSKVKETIEPSILLSPCYLHPPWILPCVRWGTSLIESQARKTGKNALSTNLRGQGANGSRGNGEAWDPGGKSCGPRIHSVVSLDPFAPILSDEGGFGTGQGIRQPDSVGGNKGVGKVIGQAPFDCACLLAKRRNSARQYRLNDDRDIVNHVSLRIPNELEVTRIAVNADQTTRQDGVPGLFPNLPAQRFCDTLSPFDTAAREAPVAIVAALLQEQPAVLVPDDRRDCNPQVVDRNAGRIRIVVRYPGQSFFLSPARIDYARALDLSPDFVGCN